MKLNEKIIYHGVRLILASVFIFASIDKIIHPQDFAVVVYNQQILPDFLINIVAILLPWMELILGICLLINRWMNGGAVMVFLLMLAFISMISFNLYRGLDVACGCFSSTSTESMTLLTFLRDFLILGLSAGLVLLVGRKNSV
jgi:uncharacterized membrane protein YphA (DoxX/SURF4 family)